MRLVDICSVEGCDRKEWTKSLCGSHYWQHRKGYAPSNKFACQQCGTPFSGRRRKFCSRACLIANVAARSAGQTYYGTCIECGGQWASKIPHSRFCSRRCQKRNSDRIKTKARRAAVFAADAEKIDPIEVFARDGWRCGICGTLTDRKQVGTQRARAPTLDHILPLSKGGKHTMRNTQCAHWKCNHQKRDRPFGQLVLV